MAGPEHGPLALGKHYHLRNGPSYTTISSWLQNKCGAQEPQAECVASSVIETNVISGVISKKKLVHYPLLWKNRYHFSRRIAIVARYCILRAVGNLEPLMNPNQRANFANLNNPPTLRENTPNQRINDDFHLANSSLEIYWLVAHIDMLLPHFHIENIMNLHNDNVRFSLTAEMIIIDYHSHEAWQVICTPSITKQGEHYVGGVRYRQYTSDVQVTFNRFRFNNFEGYPFAIPPANDLPRREEEDEEDEEEDEEDEEEDEEDEEEDEEDEEGDKEEDKDLVERVQNLHT
uniref:Uncharacterized protein n=1 Tax=Amphimedon queenslandica TaxID=400682 RepID=A0A1X7VUA9_AMPQE